MSSKNESQSPIISMELDEKVGQILTRISAETFESWYTERQIRRNIEEGQHYFNGPSRIKNPPRHSPSQLVQCHRKLMYRQENAPAEDPSPTGIYWIGSEVETEIAVPFLQEAITGPDTFVRNSIWVDYEVRVDGQALSIKGETDPAIVDQQGNPLMVTELKTKSSVEYVSSPDKHHKAQLHAYLYGLNQDYDYHLSNGLIIYIGREGLNLKAFDVTFDEEFWRETVLDWAKTHTQYRLDEVLPPADAELSWECDFCSYRERCGKGENHVADLGPGGLIPGYAEYPKETVEEYLRAHEDACLTPLLAWEYPDLADQYCVYPWECRTCGSTYEWDAPSGNIRSDNLPDCPNCIANGTGGTLIGPRPSDQDFEAGDYDG